MNRQMALFFERQVGTLCTVHSVNNALQEKYYDITDTASIDNKINEYYERIGVIDELNRYSATTKKKERKVLYRRLRKRNLTVSQIYTFRERKKRVIFCTDELVNCYNYFEAGQKFVPFTYEISSSIFDKARRLGVKAFIVNRNVSRISSCGHAITILRNSSNTWTILDSTKRKPDIISTMEEAGLQDQVKFGYVLLSAVATKKRRLRDDDDDDDGGGPPAKRAKWELKF